MKDVQGTTENAVACVHQNLTAAGFAWGCGPPGTPKLASISAASPTQGLHRPDRVFIILAIHATTPNVHRGDYKPRGLSCQVCYLCTWGSCGSWGRSSGLGVIPTHTRISDIKWISIVSVIRRAMKSAARIRLASSFPDSSILDPPMTRSPTCPSARILSNGHQNDLQPAAEPHACCCSTAHHPRHSSASQLSDRP